MTNSHESRPAVSREAMASGVNVMTTTTTQHSDYLDPHHFFAAWGSGTARFWRKRAETFRACRPSPEDFHGRATPEALSAQWDRLTATARACEARAEVAEKFGPTPADHALIAGVAEALVAA